MLPRRISFANLPRRFADRVSGSGVQKSAGVFHGIQCPSLAPGTVSRSRAACRRRADQFVAESVETTTTWTNSDRPRLRCDATRGRRFAYDRDVNEATCTAARYQPLETGLGTWIEILFRPVGRHSRAKIRDASIVVDVPLEETEPRESGIRGIYRSRYFGCYKLSSRRG